MSWERVHLKVAGRVQGVGFRYATRRQALQLQLKGWVKNLPDSRVEVWAEGPADGLQSLVDWCHRGPESAEVEQVEILERGAIATPSCEDFEIRR